MFMIDSKRHLNNSKKEELLLWYSQNFQNLFNHMYPDRKPLFITALNEYDTEKMVSTTIRPTKLKYPELFHREGCVSFVADYISYQKLLVPTVQPRILRSPAYLIDSQQDGNCFEMSSLLASLLIGCGEVNCYVVCGYANKLTCDADQSRNPLPSHIKHEMDEILYDDKPSCNKIICASFSKHTTASNYNERKFWKLLDDKKKYHLEEQQERNICHKADEDDRNDDLYGKRIHSWILIIEKNQLEKLIFIEPTTGCTHSIWCENYLTIEAIWNHSNYWINIHHHICPRDMSYNFSDFNHWAPLLAIEPWYEYCALVSNMDENDKLYIMKHLDMPSSWVPKLCIPLQRYLERYPTKCKVVKYEKAEVKFYRYDVQCNELPTQRITVYYDSKCTHHKGEVKIYKNRKDKLIKLKSNDAGKVIQQFEFGRPDMLKKFTSMTKQEPLKFNIKFEFFAAETKDKLSFVNITNSLMEIHFDEGSDLRNYEIIFDGTQAVTSMLDLGNYIIKIKQNFNKSNSSITEDENIAVKEFDLVKATVIYHYKLDEICPRIISFRRPNVIRWIRIMDNVVSKKNPENNIKKNPCLTGIFKDEQSILEHIQESLQLIHAIHEKLTRINH